MPRCDINYHHEHMTQLNFVLAGLIMKTMVWSELETLSKEGQLMPWWSPMSW